MSKQQECGGEILKNIMRIERSIHPSRISTEGERVPMPGFHFSECCTKPREFIKANGSGLYPPRWSGLDDKDLKVSHEQTDKGAQLWLYPSL